MNSSSGSSSSSFPNPSFANPSFANSSFSYLSSTDGATIAPAPEVDVALAAGWMRDLIQCPVCFDLPCPPITTCLTGHIVCNNCRPRTHGSCPVCRGSYSKTRNFVAEGIVEHLPVRCKFAKSGCKIFSEREQLDDHLARCEFRPVNCNYSGEGCEAILQVCTLGAHLASCDYRPVPCKFAKSGCEATINFKSLCIHLDKCDYRTVKCPWCPEKNCAIDYEEYPNHVLMSYSCSPNQAKIQRKISVDPKIIKIWGICRKDFTKVSASRPDVERLTTFTSFKQVFMIQMAYYRNYFVGPSIALWVSLIAPKSTTEYNNYKIFIRVWPRNQAKEYYGWKTEDLVPVNNFRDDAKGVAKKGGALLIPKSEMRKFAGAKWNLGVMVYKK